MKKITICGSIKYYETMLDLGLKLQLKGNVVLLPIFNPNSNITISKEEKELLDKIHKEKIKMSDEVYIVNENNIGESTRSEIEFAKKLNKKINYYNDIGD